MNRAKRVTLVVLAGVMLTGGLTACSSVADPDKVGLYYEVGPIEGNTFGHCFDPGTTSNYPVNDETFFLPASLRTWNIAPANGDSNIPITVNSKAEEGQPSGVQVNLWTQTNFTLNTNCGANDDDLNSPIVQFWEKIGRRYDAHTDDGWKTMLNNTIVTALETSSRSVAREYTADQLVSGVVREEAQGKIAALFQTEIKRVSGGEFFCSPTFDRNSTNCGEVQVLLKDVDYTNSAIQAARDEKQAAVERAAALLAEAQGKAQAAVAEAQGKVDAANKLNELYTNPAWVELQKAQMELDAIKACAANPNCTLVLGADGTFVGTR